MFLSLLAYLVLRVFIGLALLYLGYLHGRRHHDALRNALATRFPFLSRYANILAYKYAIFEIVVAVMYIAGAFTQVASILLAILSIKMLIMRKTFPYPLMPPPFFWFLALGIALSLFITGAGAFAIDMPL